MCNPAPGLNNDGTDVTRFFMLTVTRKEDTGVGKISNFFRFPIGGF